ncbi:thiamine biosynthesis protein ThiS [Candidatus Woesearchaeota archaeon]|nr:thiamine biosynthesis protein ThiS [Candidatus Woesearchaeota archaeon]
MKIKVFIERTNKRVIVNAKDFNELFKKIKVDSNTVIITRKNELITEKARLNNNDEIKLLSVISGG